MTTLWGCFERIVKDLPQNRWVQVRTVLSGNVAIRTRIFVDESTLIARGTPRMALSSLREGEFVEVTFHPARTGLVKADKIYVQPDAPGLPRGCEQRVVDHLGDNGTGSDSLVRFEQEDAQRLVNEVLNDRFAQLTQRTRMEGKVLRLREQAG